MEVPSQNKIVTLGLLIVGLILIGAHGDFHLGTSTIYTHKLTASEIGLLRLGKPCPGAVILVRLSGHSATTKQVHDI